MTLEELPLAVYADLSISGAGQTVPAEDSAEILTRYEQVRDLYEHRGWFYWDADDDIPNGAALGVSMLVAYHCPPNMGVPISEAGREKAERMIALHREGRSSLAPTEMQSF